MSEAALEQHDRKWEQIHEDAGYHLQDWGPPPTADSEILGSYEGSEGSVAIQIDVRLVTGPTGVNEFEIQFGEGGHMVTVLNEETALKYLAGYGAVELVPDA